MKAKRITISTCDFDNAVTEAFVRFNEKMMDIDDNPMSLLKNAMVTALYAAMIREELFGSNKEEK